MSSIKNRQHYVFKAYLDNWADERGFVYTLGKSDKRVFNTSPQNILNKRQLYKVQDLNQDERAFFELFMNAARVSENDKEEIRDYVDGYLRPFLCKKSVDYLRTNSAVIGKKFLKESINKKLDSIEESINEYIVNSEESFHNQYEGDGIQWFNKLIAGDTRFYYDNKSSDGLKRGIPEKTDFLLFVCIQYFRTIGMRRRLLESINHMIEYVRMYRNQKTDVGGKADEISIDLDKVNPEHVLHHLIMVIQTRCSAALQNADIKIVRNKTSLPFITSDQPVVNMKAKADGEAPTELVLYYPITPKVAIIINGGKEEMILDKKTKVDDLNRIIWEHSHEYIVSDNEKLLYGMLDAGL